MKRLLLAAAGLATALGLAVLPRPDLGHAQQPDTINVPVTQPIPGKAPQDAAGAPSSVAPLMQPAVPPNPADGYLPTTPNYQKLPGSHGAGKDEVYLGSSSQPRSLREYLSQNYDNIGINNDVIVEAKCGEWMICINWYSGPEAPKMARELCLELRDNPDYKLPAYVFTKGLEERQQELKRIADRVQQIREQYAKAGLSQDTPIRVPLTRYEVECAVLVGGYSSMDAARRALDHIKELKAPDPTRVHLHSQCISEKDEKDKKSESFKSIWVNPFKFSMVVHNPAVPVQRASSTLDEDELRLVRLLNEDEEFSLLKCPGRYTLVVKQFAMPTVFQQSEKATPSLLEKMGLIGSSEKKDETKILANQLARLLRMSNLDAYALHMKFCSYVCVGSYDSLDDPKLKLAQERLPQLNATLHQSAQLVLRPMPMVVPGRSPN